MKWSNSPILSINFGFILKRVGIQDKNKMIIVDSEIMTCRF